MRVSAHYAVHLRLIQGYMVLVASAFRYQLEWKNKDGDIIKPYICSKPLNFPSITPSFHTLPLLFLLTPPDFSSLPNQPVVLLGSARFHSSAERTVFLDSHVLMAVPASSSVLQERQLLFFSIPTFFFETDLPGETGLAEGDVLLPKVLESSFRSCKVLVPQNSMALFLWAEPL